MGTSVPFFPAKKFGSDEGANLLIGLSLWMLHFFNDSRSFCLSGTLSCGNFLRHTILCIGIDDKTMYQNGTSLRIKTLSNQKRSVKHGT